MRSYLFSTLVVISISGFSESIAKAEYRAFQLIIEDTVSKTKREFTSTLDPYQYIGYYPLKSTEIIDYTDSWICPGDTSQMTEICANPKTKSARQPANQSENNNTKIDTSTSNIAQ